MVLIEERVDPTTGATYFIDPATGKTAWTKEELQPKPNFKIEKKVDPITLGDNKQVGEWLWVPDTDYCYLPCQTQSSFQLGQAGQVKREDGQVVSLDAKTSAMCLAMDPQSLQDLPNMVLLNVLNEAALLHNVRKRFFNDHIYSTVGDILVAVNPFKRLPLYTDAVMTKYISADHPPPHVFAIANHAYKQLLSSSKSQAICIAGESGAGKTETMKQVLQFLAKVSKAAGGSGDNSIEERILQTNPVTEGFGNAKTVRNNNSSRFGKWTALSFKDNGALQGAFIVDYLLEKSRVSFQSSGERNYHIFYLLIKSAKKVKGLIGVDLLPASRYHFVNQSGTDIAEGWDDVEEFDILQKAFDVLGMSTDTQYSVFKVAAFILMLGNIEFKGHEASAVKDMDALERACGVLGIKTEVLAMALTSRQMAMRGRSSVTTITYKQNESVAARDALGKEMYARMFDYIMKTVNISLTALTPDFSPDSEGGLVVGVLDIFGFEIFKNNSFEQLCINYCNEQLQHHFNDHIFRIEQQYYQSEGVDVANVAFQNNEPILELLEGGNGVFAKIDDEVKIGNRGSDIGLLGKLFSTHEKDKNFVKPTSAMCDNASISFIVKHYAGDVAYNSTNFVEKNRDKVADNLGNACRESSDGFVGNLFPSEDTGEVKGGKRPAVKTLSKKFKGQLKSLMTTLTSCEPQFIRCIKPNSAKKGGVFESALCLQQIRCAGLLEVCRVRQIGYPHRKDFTDFLRIYGCIVPEAGTNCKKLCELLQEKGVLEMKDFAVGHTKVFLRSTAIKGLEEGRKRALFAHAAMLQGLVRGRRQFKRMVLCLQALKDLRTAMFNCDHVEIKSTLTECELLLPNAGARHKFVIEGKVVHEVLLKHAALLETVSDPDPKQIETVLAPVFVDLRAAKLNEEVIQDLAQSMGGLVDRRKATEELNKVVGECKRDDSKEGEESKIRRLQTAIAEAEKASVGQTLVLSAKELQQGLEELHEWVLFLKQALKDNRVAKLREGIDRACTFSKSRIARHEPLIEEAGNLVAKLVEERASGLEKLKVATEERDAGELFRLILLAKEAWELKEDSPEVVAAQLVLEEEKEKMKQLEDAYLAKLAHAIKGRKIFELEHVLLELEHVKWLSDRPEISELKQCLADCRYQKCIDDLLLAERGGRLAELQGALQRAAKGGVAADHKAMQRARRAQKKLVKEETWLLYVNWNTAMLDTLRNVESASKKATVSTYKTADVALPLYLRPEAMLEHTCIELLRDSGIIPPEQFSDEDEDDMYADDESEDGKDKRAQLTEERLLDIMKRHVHLPPAQKGTLDAYVEHDNHDWRVGVGSHFLWSAFQKTLVDVAVELTPLDELDEVRDQADDPATRSRALSAAKGGKGGAKKKKEDEVDGPGQKARDKLMIDIILPRNGHIGDLLDVKKHEHLHVFEEFTENEISEKMRGSHMQALLFSLSECLKEIFEMFASPATAHEKRHLKRHAHRRDLNDKRQSLGFAGFIRFASVFKLVMKCEADLEEEEEGDGEQSEYGDDVFAQSGTYSYGQLGKIFLSALKVKQVDTVGGLTFEEFWEVGHFQRVSKGAVLVHRRLAVTPISPLLPISLDGSRSFPSFTGATADGSLRERSVSTVRFDNCQGRGPRSEPHSPLIQHRPLRLRRHDAAVHHGYVVSSCPFHLRVFLSCSDSYPRTLLQQQCAHQHEAREPKDLAIMRCAVSSRLAGEG
jgi:myosin heavy subunit